VSSSPVLLFNCSRPKIFHFNHADKALNQTIKILSSGTAEQVTAGSHKLHAHLLRFFTWGEKTGGRNRDRTCDLLLVRQAL
jgi:hypothetical protein